MDKNTHQTTLSPLEPSLAPAPAAGAKMSLTATLTLEDLWGTNASRYAPPPLSLELNLPAGISALIGPSGAGKTRLAQTLLGTLTPLSGRIQLSGRPLFESGKANTPTHQRRIAYVPQASMLFPHMTARENITFAGPLDIGAVQALGLEPHLDKRPKALSGGEARRVALARALASGADFLILDEPFTGLDAASAQQVAHVMRLRADAGLSMLLISHALEHVCLLADYTLVMKQGRITAYGPTGDVLDTAACQQAIGRTMGGVRLRGHLQPSLGNTEQSANSMALVPASNFADTAPIYLTLAPALDALHDTSPPSKQHPSAAEPLASAQNPVWLYIESNHVSLADSKLSGTTIQNQLDVEVAGSVDEGQTMLVHMRILGTGLPLKARITRASWQQLNAVEGRKLVALVKAASITHSPA